MTIYHPREDSYLLLKSMAIPKNSIVLDMGAGSGILALHASKSAKKVIAADINPEAAKNLRHLGIKNIEARTSDLFSNIKEKFDIILFNSPYLPPDPPADPQWAGGPELVKKFLKHARTHLKPKGKIYLLVSSLTGLEDVKTALRDLNYSYRKISEQDLFFEKLYVLACTMKKPSQKP